MTTFVFIFHFFVYIVWLKGVTDSSGANTMSSDVFVYCLITFRISRISYIQQQCVRGGVGKEG